MDAALDKEVHHVDSAALRARLEELHQQLLGEGWRLVGRGERWWSRRYRRPVMELTAAGPAEPGARAVG